MPQSFSVHSTELSIRMSVVAVSVEAQIVKKRNTKKLACSFCCSIKLNHHWRFPCVEGTWHFLLALPLKIFNLYSIDMVYNIDDTLTQPALPRSAEFYEVPSRKSLPCTRTYISPNWIVKRRQCWAERAVDKAFELFAIDLWRVEKKT